MGSKKADNATVSGLVEQIVGPLCAMSALTVDPSKKLDESTHWKLKHNDRSWDLKLACRGPYCVIAVSVSGSDHLDHQSFYGLSQSAAQKAVTQLLRKTTTLHL